MSVAPQPLPAGLRWASLLALVAGITIGLMSAIAMSAVLQPMSDADLARATQLAESLDSANARVHAAFNRSYLRNLESMQGSRLLILMLLSTSASLLFVSALRMLRPLGVPREGVRRLLGGASLACAVLSTLAGAQSAAAARRAGAAADRFASEESISSWPQGLSGPLLTTVAGVLTFLVAGGFVGLWMYFKSQRVQDQLAALEKQT